MRSEVNLFKKVVVNWYSQENIMVFANVDQTVSDKSTN